MAQSRKNPHLHKTKNARSSQQMLRYGAILIVALLLAGAAALVFSPKQAPFVPEVQGAPRLVVTQEMVDFGDVPVNKYVQAVFHVRNVGDQTLHLLDREPPLQVVEGCCPPRTALSATSVPPGGEATVTVQFTMHPGMDGPHDFRVHLRSNDPLEPEKELQILSNWIS